MCAFQHVNVVLKACRRAEYSFERHGPAWGQAGAARVPVMADALAAGLAAGLARPLAAGLPAVVPSSDLQRIAPTDLPLA